ncbi:MAG: putative selenate ABC transporter substrate-binding protein [Vulcanimicrobiaceae bacterium]
MSVSRRIFVAGAAAAVTAQPLRARAADELRVAFIPDIATTAASYSEKQPLADMLQQATGHPVRIIIPTSYAATVEAIGNEGVDLAYFGALTYVKANLRYGARAVVQRVEDRRFHALFIASAANASLGSLKDLKGKSFAFGDVNSTSGHLIPAKELSEAGLDAERDLKVRYTGNHTATALAVASGQVDAGAIDESVYTKMLADKTIDAAKARVFATSKPFTDYVWAVRKDLDGATVTKIRNGFLKLSDPKVLALLRATHYVTASDREYDSIRDIARKLNLL